MVMLAFTITAFGVMVAARVTQIQSFMALMQMAIMPMFFLSGALFPVIGLPLWLSILNRLDPLTYAVDPMRRAIFDHLHVSAAARHALVPGVTWFGWHVPGRSRGRRGGAARSGDAGRGDLPVQQDRLAPRGPAVGGAASRAPGGVP